MQYMRSGIIVHSAGLARAPEAHRPPHRLAMAAAVPAVLEQVRATLGDKAVDDWLSAVGQ